MWPETSPETSLIEIRLGVRRQAWYTGAGGAGVVPSPPSGEIADVGVHPMSGSRGRGGRDAAVGACAVAPIHAGQMEDP